MRLAFISLLCLLTAACAPKHLNLGLEAPAKLSPELGEKAEVVITRTRPTALGLGLNYRFGKEEK